MLAPDESVRHARSVNAGWVLVRAPLIAAAADLTLSALLGFSLRTDVGVLLAAAVVGAAAPAFAAAFGLGLVGGSGDDGAITVACRALLRAGQSMRPSV